MIDQSNEVPKFGISPACNAVLVRTKMAAICPAPTSRQPLDTLDGLGIHHLLDGSLDIPDTTRSRLPHRDSRFPTPFISLKVTCRPSNHPSTCRHRQKKKTPQSSPKTGLAVFPAAEHLASAIASGTHWIATPTTNPPASAASDRSRFPRTTKMCLTASGWNATLTRKGNQVSVTVFLPL